MASEDTLIGNDFVVQIGNGLSPETFANFCPATDFGSLGEEKPLVDVTSLCDLARTHRNGLADGLEIPLVCNFVQGDLQLRGLYADYQADTIRRFRIVIKDTSPLEYFEFAATVRAWNVTGPVGERATLTFTLKITDLVDWVTA
jgi:hypothetical protein